MKPLLAIAVALLLAPRLHAEKITVGIQESVIVEMPGATASYTTNPDIADVTAASPGRLSITGHSAGTTQLLVITPAGTQSYLITVSPTVVPAIVGKEPGEPWTRYDGRYSSGAGRILNTVDFGTALRGSRTEFHVLHIDDLGTPKRLSDGIASLYLRHTSPGQVLTLFDALVDLSRITVTNTQVRGLHLSRGALEVHAGYASPSIYDDFFLPVGRRWMSGAGYRIDVTPGTRLTPSVYGFFSEQAGTGARRGIVGALSAEHREGENLFLRGELGVSRSIAVAGDLNYATARTQVRASLFSKPTNFPTLGLADPAGSHAELEATHRATDRLTLASRGTYDHLQIGTVPETIGAASTSLTYAFPDHISILGGVDASAVRTASDSISTIGFPIGAVFEADRFGMAASYQTLDHSGASARGDDLRLSAHTGYGRFTASVWADRQRNAPTLDLVFSAEPGLALALLRLGIIVRNPADLARALRDNAALIDLGFITGVNLDLTPRRLQAGLNLAWLGSNARSDHLRLLAIFTRDEGIRVQRDTTIASLTYSRRVIGAIDVYGSYSWWWSALPVDQQQRSGTSVDAGVRKQFDGLPQFMRRSGTIEGFAFLDPGMNGSRGAASAPLPGIEIVLDGVLKVRTDAAGAYAFARVAPGRHHVAAQLPAAPRAFFTTASHADTTAPARVDFGVVWAGARIDGRVSSDAGSGVGGIIVSAVMAGMAPMTATSDAGGRFTFAVPPGTFVLTLATQSLPAGYTIAGAAEHKVTVGTDTPQSLTFVLQVRRSIGGRAAGATEVRIESLGRTTPTDAEGNFLFRAMPAGTFTVTARVGAKTLSRVVTLPPTPTMVADVLLGDVVSPDAPQRSASTPPPAKEARGSRDRAAPTVSSGALSATASGFRIQAGAFRLLANAREVRERIERAGGEATITRSANGTMNLVTVGPFSTRALAEAEAQRLARTGIDTFVTGDHVVTAGPPARATGRSHIVQVGAFRESRNVRDLVARLQRDGEQPFTIAAKTLTLVNIGPFATRAQAAAAKERLQHAGFDAVILSADATR